MKHIFKFKLLRWCLLLLFCCLFTGQSFILTPDCLSPRSEVLRNNFLRLSSKLYTIRSKMRMNSFSEDAYYSLAEKLFSNDQETYSFFLKTDKFFLNLLSDEDKFEEFYAKVKKIADCLIKIPGFEAVYGVGFPFYGRVSIRERIYQSLLDYEQGKISLTKLKLKMKPDIDLVFVVNQERIDTYSRYDLFSDTPRAEARGFFFAL